jgi:hypothetical protein
MRIPHAAREVGKAPIGTLMSNGIDDATTNTATLTRWFTQYPNANVGIELEGAGLVFVDPDNTAAAEDAQSRGLPPTPVRHSRNPGYLYARVAGCPAERMTQLPPSEKLDILAADNCVVFGRHREGHDIYIDFLMLGGPAPAPAWAVAELVRVAAERAQRAEPGVSESDDPPVRLAGHDLARWHGEEFERTADGDVDRSDSLVVLARILFENGATRATIISALADRDLNLGWGKYSDRRGGGVPNYTKIADDVIASGLRPRLVFNGGHRVTREHATTGRIGDAPATDDPAKIHSAETSHLTTAETRSLFRTARQVAAEAPENPPWILDGFVAEGATTELDGKLKASGKTTLLMAMIARIIEGQRFLDRATTRTGVLILTEQNVTSFRAALARAGLLARDDVVVLFWADSRELSWPVVTQVAVAKAKELGYRLLIVDTLSQFAGISGDAENSSGAALEAMRPLQEAAADGLAVVISRHERKGGGEVGESARGSSAFSGAVDIVLSLRRAEGQTRESVRVIQALSRFDETPSELVIDLVDGEYVVLGTMQDVKAREASQALLDELPTTETDAIEMKDIVELFKESKIRRTTLQTALTAHVEAVTVSRIGRGKKGDPYRYWRSADPPTNSVQIHSAESPVVSAESFSDRYEEDL